MLWTEVGVRSAVLHFFVRWRFLRIINVPYCPYVVLRTSYSSTRYLKKKNVQELSHSPYVDLYVGDCSTHTEKTQPLEESNLRHPPSDTATHTSHPRRRQLTLWLSWIDCWTHSCGSHLID